MNDSTRFKKGHIPWNKGIKTPGVGGVKKGNIPWNKGIKTGKLSEEHKRKMKISSHKGKYHHNWKGGIKIDSNGYRLIRVGVNEYKFEHHLVVENYIERSLKKGELPHHINFIKTDNRLDNIFLFRNKASHTKYHAFLSRHGLDGTNNGLTSNLYIYKK